MEKSQKQVWGIMEVPELSLAPTHYLDSESNLCRKRKNHPDHHQLKGEDQSITQKSTHVDLQLNDPLPVYWEQCLDLQSGRMYYLNRKTMRKSWEWPKEEEQPQPKPQPQPNLDLELNISTTNITSTTSQQICIPTDSNHHHHHHHHHHQSSSSSSKSGGGSNNSDMIALACLNCHLLVILSKSCPSCPNCKFLHSLPPTQQLRPPLPPPREVGTGVKSLDTLSLLN